MSRADGRDNALDRFSPRKRSATIRKTTIVMARSMPKTPNALLVRMDRHALAIRVPKERTAEGCAKPDVNPVSAGNGRENV